MDSSKLVRNELVYLRYAAIVCVVQVHIPYWLAHADLYCACSTMIGVSAFLNKLHYVMYSHNGIYIGDFAMSYYM